jgi:DNA repair protein RadC
MACIQDLLGHYRLSPTTTEEEILRAAEEILTRRFQNDREAITDPVKAGRIFKMRLAHEPNEIFCVMFLDTRHRIIAIENLFNGTIDGCEVHPRVVAKRALDLNAAAVILGHQHPSGNPEPSAADRAITAQLKASLALLDVRLLDHFVVAGSSQPVSLAARGWV